MKFTVATVLAMLATITVAAPAGDSNFASPNDDGKIQLVPIKSNGQYLPVSITEASCVNLDKDLQNNIAAVGVFGPFVCTFYAGADCVNNPLKIFPGFNPIPPHIGQNSMGSYRCESL